MPKRQERKSLVMGRRRWRMLRVVMRMGRRLEPVCAETEAWCGTNLHTHNTHASTSTHHTVRPTYPYTCPMYDLRTHCLPCCTTPCPQHAPLKSSEQCRIYMQFAGNYWWHVHADFIYRPWMASKNWASIPLDETSLARFIKFKILSWKVQRMWQAYTCILKGNYSSTARQVLLQIIIDVISHCHCHQRGDRRHIAVDSRIHRSCLYAVIFSAAGRNDTSKTSSHTDLHCTTKSSPLAFGLSHCRLLGECIPMFNL